MRTATLTLDDDVATLLDRARKEKGQSVEAVVNKALRSALSAFASGDSKPKPSMTATSVAGSPPATFQTLVELVSRHRGIDRAFADDLEQIRRDQPRLDEDPWAS